MKNGMYGWIVIQDILEERSSVRVKRSNVPKIEQYKEDR